MSGVNNVGAKWEGGNLIFQLEAGQNIEFRDSSGSTIMKISETEVNCDVTFKAPTVSTEGA
jgi:hypothetical protein